MGCNHCLDAECLKGCPVDAYTKDPVTGIVLHSADACIGCQYCVWNCPYYRSAIQSRARRGGQVRYVQRPPRPMASNQPASMPAPKVQSRSRLLNMAGLALRTTRVAERPGMPSAGAYDLHHPDHSAGEHSVCAGASRRRPHRSGTRAPLARLHDHAHAGRYRLAASSCCFRRATRCCWSSLLLAVATASR